MANGNFSLGLPEVHDEAADTPAWLPITGLILVALLSLWMLARHELTTEARPTHPTAEVVEQP